MNSASIPYRCLLALLVMLAVVVRAQAPDDAQAPPAIGTDLERLPWYASADLPPNATVDMIRSKATLTTPTAVLRSATPFASGMLFCIFTSPVAPQQNWTGQVTIGDIDGEDETFLNGQKIGETRGWGVSDFGMPRSYKATAAQLQKGANVLALRITAWRDKQTFGLKRGPFTFSYSHAAQTSSGAPADSGAQQRQDRAKRAVFTSDPELTSTERLQSKRGGFGRFGEFLFDGLPALANVSPTQIAVHKGALFEVAVDSVTSVGIAPDSQDAGISWCDKRVRVNAIANGQPISYTVHSSVLYPGAVFTLEDGAVLPLRLRLHSRSAAAIRASADELRKAGLAEAATRELEIYLISDGSKKAPPALLALSGVSANVTQSVEQMEIALAANRSSAARKAYLWFPTGIRAVDFASQPATVLDAAASADSESTAAETLKRWLRVGLYEPAATEEFFRVLPGDQFVRVYQAERFTPAGHLNVPPFLVRPPQIDFAIQQLKYPVHGPATTATGVLTFSGEAFATDGTAAAAAGQRDSSSAGDYQVTWYDLPIPPMNQRGLLAVPGQKQWRELLNHWALSDLGSSTSRNAVDAIYKSRCQAFQSFSYLPSATQAQLVSDSNRVVPAALSSAYWQEHLEPLSGHHYWWTYFIEGPFFQRFDQDWGNGLSLYGLYTYIKYTGQWKLAREAWDSVERMFSWFTETDDWEWMRASNGGHGHGTGAGDCESATYAACVSYARLAEGCGCERERDYGIYMSARAALFALNRFVYADFAQQNELGEKGSYPIGFHEGNGFLVSELDGYPWNVTSAISGNGVQPVNFDLYLKYAPEALRKYEQVFENAYPRWAEADYQYPIATLYHGNSGYITLPHIYLRARLGETPDVLHELLQKAQPNAYLWWIAPPVIAEVMNAKADAAVVLDWGHCAFLGGDIARETEGEKRRVNCTARFENIEAPDVVEFLLPKKPQQFQVNEGPVPLTDSSFVDGVLTLKLRRPGLNTVTIQY